MVDTEYRRKKYNVHIIGAQNKTSKIVERIKRI